MFAHARPGHIRDARVGEIDCSEHFKNRRNYELFVNPGSISTFKHAEGFDEALYFLGDDLSEEKAKQSEQDIHQLLDIGVSKALFEDLLKAFKQGFAYVILYADTDKSRPN